MNEFFEHVGADSLSAGVQESPYMPEVRFSANYDPQGELNNKAFDALVRGWNSDVNARTDEEKKRRQAVADAFGQEWLDMYDEEPDYGKASACAMRYLRTKFFETTSGRKGVYNDYAAVCDYEKSTGATGIRDFADMWEHYKRTRGAELAKEDARLEQFRQLTTNAQNIITKRLMGDFSEPLPDDDTDVELKAWMAGRFESEDDRRGYEKACQAMALIRSQQQEMVKLYIHETGFVDEKRYNEGDILQLRDAVTDYLLDGRGELDEAALKWFRIGLSGFASELKGRDPGAVDRFAVSFRQMMGNISNFGEDEDLSTATLGAVSAIPSLGLPTGEGVPWSGQDFARTKEGSRKALLDNEARLNAADPKRLKRMLVGGEMNKAIQEGLEFKDGAAWWEKAYKSAAQMAPQTLPWLMPYVGMPLGAATSYTSQHEEGFSTGLADFHKEHGRMPNPYEMAGLNMRAAEDAAIGTVVEMLPGQAVGIPFTRWMSKLTGAKGVVGAFARGVARLGETRTGAVATDIAAGVFEEAIFEPVAQGVLTLGADAMMDMAGVPAVNRRSVGEVFGELHENVTEPGQFGAIALTVAVLGGGNLGRTLETSKLLREHSGLLLAAGMSEADVAKVRLSDTPVETAAELYAKALEDDMPAVLERIKEEARKNNQTGELLRRTGRQDVGDADLQRSLKASWDYLAGLGVLPQVEERPDGRFHVSKKVVGENGSVTLKEYDLEAAEADAFIAMCVSDAEAVCVGAMQAGVWGLQQEAVRQIYGESAARAIFQNGKSHGLFIQEVADVEGMTPELAEEARNNRFAMTAEWLGKAAAQLGGKWVQRAGQFRQRLDLEGLAYDAAGSRLFRDRTDKKAEFGGRSVWGSLLTYVRGQATVSDAVEDVFESVADMQIAARAEELMERQTGASAMRAAEAWGQAVREMAVKVKPVIEGMALLSDSPQLEAMARDGNWTEERLYMSTLEAMSHIAKSGFLGKRDSLPASWRGGLDAAYDALDYTQEMKQFADAYKAVKASGTVDVAPLEDVLAAQGVVVSDVFRDARVDEQVISSWRKAKGVVAARAAVEGTGAVGVQEALEAAEESEREIAEAEAARAAVPPMEEAEQKEAAQQLNEELASTPPPPQAFSAAPESMRGVFRDDSCTCYAGGFYSGWVAVDKLRDSVEIQQVKVGDKGRHGVTNALVGEFQMSAPPIIVWRRKNGDLEVISGRHRYALAESRGVKFMRADVYNEDAGHDAKWARLMDFENNMRDDQADEKTAFIYVRETGYDDETLYNKGLMRNKTKSKRGAMIARHAREELATRFMNDAVSAKDAETIVNMTKDIADKGRIEEIQRRCCMLLDERKSWEYIGAMVQLMASKESVFLKQGLLDLGADFEADLARAAKYIEICTRQLNEAITVMKSGRKMSGKQAELARRLGQLTTSAEDSQQRLDALMTMKAMFDNIGMYPDLVAGAQMWDGKTEVDAVGMALERGMREAQANEEEEAMSVEERLAKAEAEAARKAAEEATGMLFGGSFSVAEVSGGERAELREHFFDVPYGESPKGWWVHGRSLRQDLDTGYVIQMTKSNDVGLQYGDGGSVWYLRPKKDAFVLDATTEEGLGKIEDALRKGYDEDTLPFSMYRALEENGDTTETLAELFNPPDIVDSAGAYDNAEWVGWLYDALGVDMVITEDGAVALNVDAMEGAKVYDDTDRKDFDLVHGSSWSVASQAEGQENVTFSIRKEEPPEKVGIGYKVFYQGKDGKLYPPMVANPGGADTPVGVWLDADEGTRAGTSKTGRPQVKAGGKGTQGGSGKLSYRPGWHLGEIPYALQFNRVNPLNGKRELFPADFVWAEVEYAMDVDYQQEAMSYGYTENGKFRHSYAGLPRLPKNGFYKYRTNPNPETDPWIITGAMKVKRVLTPQEVADIVRKAGREPQKAEGQGNADITFSTVNLDDYFLPLQEGEADVPIDKLYTLKNEPRKSVDNARRFMRMAANGGMAKRGAVAVALAGDGSYTVVDGNATCLALAGLGAKTVRVKVVGKDTGSRLNNSAYLVQDGKPGADADGLLRTHGLDGLAGDAATQRVFGQAEENLPLLEKLVAAAAAKVGGQKMMRPANRENGLATKKPSTAIDKAKREYKGDISCVVDLIGGTVVMPSDGDFGDAIKAIKKALPEGASIARVKKLGFQDTAPRYKDVKVSVRFANGGIGEIILVEGRINEAKFNRGGHNIYEVKRELEPYTDSMPEVKEAVKKLDELSALVYAEGVDAAALERAKAIASMALEALQPLSKKLSNSSSVRGILKSPESLSNFIKPDSVLSTASPRVSLIQNITEDNIPNSSALVNGFSASVTSQAEVKRAVRERLNEIALRDASTNEVFLQLGDEGRKLRAAGKWSQKEALEALARVEALVNRTRALLPPKLAKLGKLNKTLAWVKVYADMVRSGEVKINESITSTPITQKFVEKMNKSRDEALLNGLSEAEAQDVLKNIGAERLNLSLSKVTDYCAARLQVLLKERSLDSIMFMARRMLQDDTMLDLERMEDELRNALLTAGEAVNMRQADLLLRRIGKKRIDLLKRMVEEAYKNAFPKKQAGQRSPRGKMDADAYRMLMKMNAAMGMSAEQVNSAQTALCAQLNELNESVPDYGEKRTAMEEELLVLGTFGNWEGMSVEKAADAAKQFLEFVQTSRTAWQAKLEDEKEYYAYLREQMGANFTIEDDPNTRSAGKQAQKPKEKTKQFADSAVTNLMNYGQLMRSAAPKLGQAFTMARRNEMAEANANLANDNRAFENAFYCFVAAAAGSAKEAACVKWLNKFSEVTEETGVWVEEGKVGSLVMETEEARKWVAMSKEQREKRRGEIAKADAARMRKTQNIPTEEDIPALEAELANMDGKTRVLANGTVKATPGKAGKIKIRRQGRREKVQLRMSRDQALNLILILEQDDYRHLVSHWGFIPRDAAGNEVLDPEGNLDEVDVRRSCESLYQFVGEDGLRLGYNMRGYVEENGKRLAKVFEEYNGCPLNMRKKYWKGNFNLAPLKEKDMLADPGSVMGSGYGFMIDRIQHYSREELTNSATLIFGQTMQEQLNYIHTAHITRLWRRLLQDSEFANLMRANMGEDWMKAIKTWINIIDKANGAGELNMWRMTEAQQWLMRGIAVASLAGNMSTIVKQGSAILHAVLGGEVPTGARAATEAGAQEFAWRGLGLGSWAKSMAHVLSGRAKVSLKALTASKFYQARIDSTHKLVANRMGMKAGGKQHAYAGKWAEYMMGWMEKVDRWSNLVSCSALADAVYRKIETLNNEGKLGLSQQKIEAAALRAVGRMLNEVAQPKMATQKTLATAAKNYGVSLGGFLTMFRSETLNKVAMFATRAKEGEFCAGLGGYLAFGTMNALVNVLLAYIRTGGGDDGEDKETWRKIAAFVYTCFFADVYAIPMFGDALKFVESRISGSYFRDNGAFSALGIDRAIKSMGKLYDAATGETELSAQQYVKHLQSALRGAAVLMQAGKIFGLDRTWFGTVMEGVLDAATTSNMLRMGVDVKERVAGEEE